MNEIVSKVGYIPKIFNLYNAAEICRKSPTITAASGVGNTSGKIELFEKVDNE